MDTKGCNLNERGARGVIAAALIIAAACGRSTAVAPPDAPAATPAAVVEEEALPSTLSEARSLRRAAKLDLYERGLRKLSGSDDASIASRASSLLALHLFDQKRYDEAVTALQAAAERSPLLAPFLRLRLIEAELGRGNVAGAIQAAEQVLASPDTTAATVAGLRLPALHAAAGNREAADSAFVAAMAVPIDENSEKELLDLAALLGQHGRGDLAAKVRMRLLTDYTSGRFTEKIYGDLAASSDSPLDLLPLEDATRLARSLARANRYDQALDYLQRIRTRFPESGTSDFYRGVYLRSLFNSRGYTRLVDETATETFTDPSLLLLRARAAWRDDRPELFLSILEDLEKRFPRSREAIEAKVQRAKYYVTDNIDYEESLENLKAALDAGASGNDGENLWTLGWTYVLAGRDDEALATFDKYLATYPDGDYRTNSLFWSGKVHERNGRLAERDASLRQVIAEYPYNYYAYRAREILGIPTVAADAVANGNVFPNVDADLAAIPAARLDTVRELLAIELGRDASREMKAIAAAWSDNLGAAFLLADVYVQSGEPFRANGILQRRFRQFVRHGGENVPRRFWEILYPLNYWEAIEREAARRELDPYLIASIIRQESGFEPTTVSNAGAVGLMQIMPNEGARIASLAGLDNVTREQLFDPYENIAVGAAEYSQKLARMEGNPILAIAAYNAGEEAVGRWLARMPLGDPDLFVESIAYAETKLYVKTVTRNRFEYRRIYESSSQQSRPRSQ